MSTDWQEIYRGDHRAVLTVGCSSFLPSLIEQDEREIITPNISNTTVASATNVDVFGFTHLVICKIHLMQPCQNPACPCGAHLVLCLLPISHSLLAISLSKTLLQQISRFLFEFLFPLLDFSEVKVAPVKRSVNYLAQNPKSLKIHTEQSQDTQVEL